MTQVFGKDGQLVSVTVVEAGPCPVLAVNEGSIQIGFDLLRESRANKAILGCFKKVKVAPRKLIREVARDAGKEYKVGEELKVDLFEPGDFVDVTGTSIGKGFQGGMKRWNWSGGPMSHGSMSHRRVGSIGASTTPGRVFKGHHLPGHMGDARVTVQNLRVVKIDSENNILLIRGAVPGARNGYLLVRSARKKQKIKS